MTGDLETPPKTLRDQLRAARQRFRADGGAVLDHLRELTALDERALREQLSAEAGVEVLQLNDDERPDFKRLDRPTARAWRCAPLLGDGRPKLAAADPWDESLLQRVSQRLGSQVTPVAASKEALDRLLGGDEAPVAAQAAPTSTSADGQVVAFVDSAVRLALRGGASDVHFECDRLGVTVKHRVDGVLKRHARLEGAQLAQEAISRIKVLAQLDITERRLPQDGRFRLADEAEGIDLRVSIMPSIFGEDAVLRLLDKAQLRKGEEAVSLAHLGFAPSCYGPIRELAMQPSGMLLVTGPTGSGKTTTLYAVLSETNSGLEKTITIEDPVEYELPGILQIPVNERKGLTFARGLRSILRHDPDRILVGEIRDAETAEIAVQSSLTGHLVFTTVHANGMTDVIGRFRHFGLDMFGFMSSLNGVIVQRLVRRLCASCVDWRDPLERESAWFVSLGGLAPERLPTAIGCSACGGTGYRGRFVLAEVHLVDDALREDVIAGAPLSVLRRHSDDRDVETLAAQAVRRIAASETTLEEIKRVVGWR